MSKREHDADGDLEGPTSKAKKGEDTDDGSGSARSGRVRKKSAKVLEMEEFEQAEKVSHVTKKSKTPKSGQASAQSEDADTPKHAIPSKMLKTQGESASQSVKLPSEVGAIKVETLKSIPPELTPRIPQSSAIVSGISSPTSTSSPALSSPPVKQELEAEMQDTPEVLTPTLSSNVKKEDQKSVIKYLLSSPAAGSAPSVNTKIISSSDTQHVATSGKKSSKKVKTESLSTVKPKQKEKKVKKESVPSELIPVAQDTSDTPSLKMKILSGSNPMTAQVALQVQSETPKQPSATKTKKVSKKLKEQQSADQLEIKAGILGLPVEGKSPTPKKNTSKKASKQKEKLIQDAITAAQQMPNLAALVASQPHQQTESDMVTPAQKAPKKRPKSSSPASASEAPTDDTDDAQAEDETGESTLVIAETEKKKKKTGGRKKAMKEADPLTSPKGDKKMPKRAPTAYMLFCNTHRPDIVADNPGIEFAGISRKLGELWQGLSNKQKLQWRRKAQRRKKKSNLISTGKITKEMSALTAPAAVSTSTISQMATQMTTNQKLANLIQKNQVAVHDDTPQSPTKNLSIEPIDVAAHLKLLGESLSIIGMRLQEHKGMIAVQGSLSVLLDSLICACGPLLCLTQQVPGMDGCAPSVHAQTLDSVAYVMPGL